MRGYRHFSEMNARTAPIDMIVMELTFVQSKFKFQISSIFTEEQQLNNNKPTIYMRAYVLSSIHIGIYIPIHSIHADTLAHHTHVNEY